MIRRPPRSTHCISSAASDVYKRQVFRSLPEIFFLSFKDENGIERKIIAEEDYESAKDVMHVVIKITAVESQVYKPKEEEKKTHSANYMTGNITPAHSDAIIDEINCSMLETIDEGDSILLNGDELEEESKDAGDQEKDKRVKMRCVFCRGYGNYENGMKCNECEGSGDMNPYIYEHMQELFRRRKKESLNLENKMIDSLKGKIEVQFKEIGKLKAELKKKSVELENALRKLKLMQSSQSQVISSAIYKGDTLSCSLCRRNIENGKVGYSCQSCPNTTVCEDCEENYEHKHALLKFRTEGITNYYEATIEPEFFNAKADASKSQVEVLLTIWNTGKRTWPEDTVLRLEEKGEELVKVESVKQGKKCDMVFRWNAPEGIEGIYRFRLFGRGCYFGRYLQVNVLKTESGNIGC
eukprot:TRINITY_DN14577_c0_g1_i1.p1 TRINITY_DN14577_c0_g1~~TRINITY_DN14577_c0_g1_i1.p1  ORF type:complete len:419 (-),score=105.34 TRINITY_DN14577_c0_g1_i1:327-1559(-)